MKISTEEAAEILTLQLLVEKVLDAIAIPKSLDNHQQYMADLVPILESIKERKLQFAVIWLSNAITTLKKSTDLNARADAMRALIHVLEEISTLLFNVRQIRRGAPSL